MALDVVGFRVVQVGCRISHSRGSGGMYHMTSTACFSFLQLSLEVFDEVLRCPLRVARFVGAIRWRDGGAIR